MGIRPKSTYKRVTRALLIVCVAASLPAAVHASGAPAAVHRPTKGSPRYTDPALGQVLQRLTRGEAIHSAARVRQGKIRVEVLGAAGANVIPSVRHAGGMIVAKVDRSFVLADVPTTTVHDLEGTGAVRSVRLPVDMSEPQGPVPVPQETPAAAGLFDTGKAPVLRTGQYGTDAIQRVGIAPWHQAGFTGNGVKVGIIDTFDGDIWTQVAAAGEIPAQPAGTFCRDEGADCSADFWKGGEHGVAVSEIVKDMAPGATLYLATVTSTTDVQQAVNWFQSQGVKIISRSETAHYDGPGDGTGPLATVQANAVAAGMAWFNAAGNSAKRYFRSVWKDADGDKWMEFPDGTEAMLFDCSFINGLRWNDWGANRTDYDIYVYDTYDDFIADRNNGYVAVGSSYQSTNPPIELVVNRTNPKAAPCSTAKDADGRDDDVMAIYKFADGNGTAGDVLEFMINGNFIEFPSSDGAYSATGPAADTRTPGTAAVGAIHVDATTIAPYSSRGPSNDGRIRPDLAAASNMTSASYTLTSDGKFPGTSSATPVVSGAAAVVLGQDPSLTPQQLVERMRSYVVDRGAAGADNEFGAGELRMPAPPPPGPGGPGGPGGGAPTVTSVKFRPTGKKLTAELPFTLTWATATPQSSAYIARSVNRGAARLVTSIPGSRQTAKVTMTLGKLNQFAVSYADSAGSVSPFLASARVTPFVYDDTNRKVRFGRGWRHVLDGKAWNSTLTATNQGASRARLTFKGIAVSLVLTKSGNSGAARVFVDGRSVGKVNLHSRAVENRRIVMNLFAAKKGKHVIEVQPLKRGASGWVFVDGFIVLR